MGKIIRLTVTITTTETWTIVWLADDESLSHPPTVLRKTRNLKEEPDETLQVTLTETTDQPSASDSMAPPNLPETALNPPPAGVSTRSTAGRQSKRARSRRAADNPQSK